jgi:hypothetical protein
MTMLKNSKSKTNYFKVNIYPTLMGEFLIQKEYGLLSKKKPTIIEKKYTASYREALIVTLDSVLSSAKKGYFGTI